MPTTLPEHYHAHATKLQPSSLEADDWSSASNTTCGLIAAMVRDPEYLTVALFCAFGLWLTFYAMRFFSDFGEIVASLEAF